MANRGINKKVSKRTNNRKTGNRKKIQKNNIRKISIPRTSGAKRKQVPQKYTPPREHTVSKKTVTALLAAFGVIIACMLTVLYIQKYYTVTNVYVEGNLHYTSEEIRNMIMEGPLGSNSLYLSLKYKNKEITDVPFIETMSVKIVSPDTIRIIVYEKALAGYVEYLGRYMYFDREGMIVETSEMKTKEIPQVTGMSFDHVVLHERLPVENEDIFNQILDVTQLLTKYGIRADRIYFDKDYEMTLYFDDAKVKIGNDNLIDEKIMKLQNLLPELEGKSGTLHMENYTEDTRNITFNMDTE